MKFLNQLRDFTQNSPRIQKLPMEWPAFPLGVAARNKYKALFFRKQIIYCLISVYQKSACQINSEKLIGIGGIGNFYFKIVDRGRYVDSVNPTDAQAAAVPSTESRSISKTEFLADVIICIPQLNGQEPSTPSMGRTHCDKSKVKKGIWSPDEDAILKSYIHKNGTGGSWSTLAKKSGLNRSGKSCRLRWLNYLRPGIKHGGFTQDEENMCFDLGLYRSGKSCRLRWLNYLRPGIKHGGFTPDEENMCFDLGLNRSGKC